MVGRYSSSKGEGESRIRRWIKAPIRGAISVRDLYVRSMNSCAGHATYAGGVYGCPATHVTTLPKSFSVKSTTSDDDLRELVRASSTRGSSSSSILGDGDIDLEFLMRNRSAGSAKVVPRSQSLRIPRIEEHRIP